MFSQSSLFKPNFSSRCRSESRWWPRSLFKSRVFMPKLEPWQRRRLQRSEERAPKVNTCLTLQTYIYFNLVLSIPCFPSNFWIEMFSQWSQKAYQVTTMSSTMSTVLLHCRVELHWTPAVFFRLHVSHHRYCNNLDKAKGLGIKKAFIVNLNLSFNYMVMFLTYALAFWYGCSLVLND